MAEEAFDQAPTLWYEAVKHKFSTIEYKYNIKNGNIKNDKSLFVEENESDEVNVGTEQDTKTESEVNQMNNVEQKPKRKSHRQRYRAKLRRQREQNAAAVNAENKVLEEKGMGVEDTDSFTRERNETTKCSTTIEETSESILINLLDLEIRMPNVSSGIIQDVQDLHINNTSWLSKHITSDDKEEITTLDVNNGNIHQYLHSSESPQEKRPNIIRRMFSQIRKTFNRLLKCGYATNTSL